MNDKTIYLIEYNHKSYYYLWVGKNSPNLDWKQYLFKGVSNQNYQYSAKHDFVCLIGRPMPLTNVSLILTY